MSKPSLRDGVKYDTTKMQIVWRDVAALIPYARNARTHTDEQVAQIAASIKEFGWTNPVLTDGANGIVAGHGRVLAARKLGLDQVPTLALDGLSKGQLRAYVLADNKLAENAGWDRELLAVELGELKDEGFDLSIVGFSGEELASLFEDKKPGYRDGAGFVREGVTDWKDAETFFAMPDWLAPIWDAAGTVLVQFSGGKDSTAAALWAAHHKAGKTIQLVFSDPGVEFPGMGGHIHDVAAFLGVEYEIVKPKQEWWAWLSQKGEWPSIIYRPCANDLVHKPFAKFVREHDAGTVLLTGSRAEEANRGSTKTERSELGSLGAKAKDYQHFAPCFSVKKETENEIIASSGIPLWEGYSRGFVRTACWCCPGQCGAQALALSRNYPGLCEDIRRWEKRIGKFQTSNNKTLDDMIRAGENGEKRRAQKSDADHADAVGGEESTGDA